MAEMTPSARTEDTALTLTVPKEWEAYDASFGLVTKEAGVPGRDETLPLSGTTDVAGLRVRSTTMVLVDRDGAQALNFAHFANGDSAVSRSLHRCPLPPLFL